jgi:hypothetical protein
MFFFMVLVASIFGRWGPFSGRLAAAGRVEIIASG